MTLGISIAAGASGGFLCKFDFWHPVHALFKDDDHFYEVVEHYPREYLFGGDEVYDEGKANFHDVQHALSACRAQMHGDAEQVSCHLPSPAEPRPQFRSPDPYKWHLSGEGNQQFDVFAF